jgi:TPR repeat protein
MSIRYLATIWAAYLLLSLAPQAWATARLALVIGNASYQGALPPLSNSVKDAEAVAEVLEKLGFQVTLQPNADKEAFLKALYAFKERLTAPPGQEGLVFYTGHGLRGTDGKNYLMPVDAKVEYQDDLQWAGIPVEQVLAEMMNANPRISILIIDACRDTPRLRSRGKGLLDHGMAPMEPQVGSYIAFATAPNEKARDYVEPGDPHSPFVAALLKHLPTPGLTIEQVFKRVRKTVRERTDGEQIPWDNNLLEGEYHFVPTSGELQAGGQERPALPGHESPPSVPKTEPLSTTPAPSAAALRVSPNEAVEKNQTGRTGAEETAGKSYKEVTLEDTNPQKNTSRPSPLPIDSEHHGPGSPEDIWQTASKEEICRPLIGDLIAPIWLKRIAEHDDPVAKAKLAYQRYGYIRFKFGFAQVIDEVRRLAQESVPDLQVMANRGNPSAQRTLADLYFIGLVRDDHQLARDLYQKAARQGYGFWGPLTSNMEPPSTEPVFGGAFRDFSRPPTSKMKPSLNPAITREANQGDPAAQYVIGNDILTTQADQRNVQVGLDWLEKSAHQGCRGAQLALGQIFEEGNLITKDPRRALEWYRKAAQTGSVDTQIKVAKIYETGQGTKKDEQQAASWYQKAAEHFDTEARLVLGSAYSLASAYPDSAPDIEVFLSLGTMYEEGRGVERNDREAAKWYRKAAEKLSKEAQFRLGMMYKEGRGVEKDQTQAWKWLVKAAVKYHEKAEAALLQPEMRSLQSTLYHQIESMANDGDAEAQFELASIRHLEHVYAKTKYTKSDVVRITDLYIKAAENGNWDAQHRVMINDYQIFQHLEPEERKRYLPIMTQHKKSYINQP